MSSRAEPTPWLVLAAMTAALGITFRPLLSVDEIPVFRDLLLFIVPIKHFLGDHLRRGELPLWNPWLCLGSPFLAAMHMGVFYPPSALLLLPLPIGFNLFLLAHYAIALLGMWSVLRDRGLDAASAAAGGVTFAIGGYAVSLLNIPKELHGLAWLPWALFFWARWLRSASRRDLALCASAIALQILGGSVETTLMTVSLLAAAGLSTTARSARDLLRAGSAFAAVIGGAAALTAFQILPTLEYGAQAGRAEPLPAAQVLHWSLQRVSLLQLLFPVEASPAADLPALGVGLEPDPPMLESIYLGAPALCLALVGIVAGRERRLWGLVLAAAVLGALGSSTPAVPFLYDLAPTVFGHLRYPEKLVLLLHVSMVILAAEGLARLRADARRAWKVMTVAAGALALVACGAWLFTHENPRAYLAWLSWVGGRTPSAVVTVAEALRDSTGRLVLVASATLAVVALGRARRIEPWLACALLVALQLGDLASVRWRTLVTMPWQSVEATKPLVDVAELRELGQSVFHYTDVVEGARDPSRFRLAEWPIRTADWVEQYRMLWSTLFGNVGMFYGVSSLGGADGFQRRDMRTLLDVFPSLPLDGVARLLGVLGVSHLIGPSPRQSPLLHLVHEGGADVPFVYRVSGALPLVHLANRLRVEPSEPRALGLLAREDFDPRSEAVVERLPEGWTGETAVAEASDRADVVSRGTEDIAIRTHTAGERLLVVNQSFYPGWRASIDGQPVNIVRANALVRGVRIPGGDHVVEFHFEPTGFRLGSMVAAAAALVWVGLVLQVDWPRPRRSNSQARA